MQNSSSSSVPAEQNTLNEMPEELLVHIFSFLEPGKLKIISGVCRQWKRIANDDRLWRQHFQRKREDLDSLIRPSRDPQWQAQLSENLRDDDLGLSIFSDIVSPSSQQPHSFSSVSQSSNIHNKRRYEQLQSIESQVSSTRSSRFFHIPQSTIAVIKNFPSYYKSVALRLSHFLTMILLATARYLGGDVFGAMGIIIVGMIVYPIIVGLITGFGHQLLNRNLRHGEINLVEAQRNYANLEAALLPEGNEEDDNRIPESTTPHFHHN